MIILEYRDMERIIMENDYIRVLIMIYIRE